MSQELCHVRGVNVVVSALVALFAISSWVDINGLWVELPILTQKLPEGWNLPSYMAVVIQLANIAPLVYTLTSIFSPHRNIEVPVIYSIIVVGAVSCLLLSFFWDATAVVAGELHSVGLLTLQFFLALVDCTSSVAYLSFMSAYDPKYLSAFYVGEGFSGLIPSLVSLAQGAGDIKCVNFTSFENVTVDGEPTIQPTFSVYPVYETPKFSIEVFFLFLFSMLIISLIAFSLLHWWPYARKERKDWRMSVLASGEGRQSSRIVLSQSSGSYELDVSGRQEPPRLLNASSPQPVAVDDSSTTRLLQTSLVRNSNASTADGVLSGYVDEVVEINIQSKQLGKCEYLMLLLLTAWVNGLANGVLPSIQSYSCLPYGIKAYHLSVTLSAIANPLACFVTFFLRARSLFSVAVLSVLGSAVSGYTLYTAAASPTPPLLHHESAGSVTVVMAWVVVMFILTYTKVSAAVMLKGEGKRALLWCGAFTQIGSLVGALAMFFVVSFYKLFQQANLCM